MAATSLHDKQPMNTRRSYQAASLLCHLRDPIEITGARPSCTNTNLKCAFTFEHHFTQMESGCPTETTLIYKEASDQLPATGPGSLTISNYFPGLSRCIGNVSLYGGHDIGVALHSGSQRMVLSRGLLNEIHMPQKGIWTGVVFEKQLCKQLVATCIIIQSSIHNTAGFGANISQHALLA